MVFIMSCAALSGSLFGFLSLIQQQVVQCTHCPYEVVQCIQSIGFCSEPLAAVLSLVALCTAKTGTARL